ncbi:MAG: NAD(P)H-binding protein [Anaerolineales bacterium]|nr:NAD(P)H-binding protein [Anaerolineales bacterium]
MILVTGGAGFIGQRLIARLSDEGHSIRTLLRPSDDTPRLPRGVSVQAAISSLGDPRGLRAALVGVQTIFHLAGVDWNEPRPDFRAAETEGTRNLLEAAQDAGVRRLVFLSHLDADRAAAFPMLKAKGIAEEFIRQSGLDYTILRSSLVFGPGDHFTTGLAKLLAFFPRFFPIPANGETILQPVWVEDLVTCLAWCLEDDETIGQLIELGGPEHLSLRHLTEQIMRKAGLERQLVPVRPSHMRLLLNAAHIAWPGLPASRYWLDYLAADRITSLDTMPRLFHLLPARFSQKNEYLAGVDWRAELQEDMKALRQKLLPNSSDSEVAGV